jgi:hypothetical protein
VPPTQLGPAPPAAELPRGRPKKCSTKKTNHRPRGPASSWWLSAERLISPAALEPTTNASGFPAAFGPTTNASGFPRPSCSTGKHSAHQAVTKHPTRDSPYCPRPAATQVMARICWALGPSLMAAPRSACACGKCPHLRLRKVQSSVQNSS